jgi:hypothetical protein
MDAKPSGYFRLKYISSFTEGVGKDAETAFTATGLRRAS